MYKIILKGNQVLVNDSVVLENVSKHFDVKLGSNICEGNRYLIFITSDVTISALSIDNLSCADEMEIKNNIGNLSNVTDIYLKETSSVEDVLVFNDIYAKTYDGDINITEYLK